jgi:hypothetical protein
MIMSDSSQSATVITGEANVKGASLLAVRGALRLEVRGMKRRGQSARALANQEMGTSYRTAKAAYAAFDKYVTARTGIASRPL